MNLGIRTGRKPRPSDIGIKQVAEALGLSASTVSRALNGVYGVNAETKELVQRKAEEMGYVANLGAKQLAGKGSGLIGILFPEFEFEASTTFLRIFPLLQKALKERGKDALFFSVPFLNYQEHWLAECVASRQLEGCVVLAAFSERHPLVKEAIRLGIPFVNFEGVQDARCSSLTSDDFEGGRLAGEHLADMGHRIVGYIDGPQSLRVSRERLGGFREALAGRGIELPDERIAVGDFSGASGTLAMEQLLAAAPEITAVFCANDLMAMGAMLTLGRRGIAVPGQVSIVGYDDDNFAQYLSPPLTTIRNGSPQTASLVAELLTDLLEGKPSRRLKTAPRIVVRESVRQLAFR